MRVESANSGRPERPPCSVALAVSRSRGRLTVVLPTIMPSMRWRRAIPTTSSRSPSVRSGAILSSSGVRAPRLGRPLARIDHAGEQVVERRGLLQVAQSGRVRRRDIDGEEVDMGGERRDAGHVVGGTIDRILVGADVDADDAAAAARREARRDGRDAVAVEAEPVDHRLVGIEAKQPRPRIARLRLRRHAAGFDEAEPEPEQRVHHFGILVEAGREPDRIGEPQAESRNGELCVVRRRARQRRALECMQRQARAPARDRACAATARRGGRTGRSRRELREHMPVRSQRQRLHPAHRGERQWCRRDAGTARRRARARSATRRRAPRRRRRPARDPTRRRNAAPPSRPPARRSRNG